MPNEEDEYEVVAPEEVEAYLQKVKMPIKTSPPEGEDPEDEYEVVTPEELQGSIPSNSKEAIADVVGKTLGAAQPLFDVMDVPGQMVKETLSNLGGGTLKPSPENPDGDMGVLRSVVTGMARPFSQYPLREKAATWEDITYDILTDGGVHPEFARISAQTLDPIFEAGLDPSNLLPTKLGTGFARRVFSGLTSVPDAHLRVVTKALTKGDKILESVPLYEGIGQMHPQAKKILKAKRAGFAENKIKIAKAYFKLIQGTGQGIQETRKMGFREVLKAEVDEYVLHINNALRNVGPVDTSDMSEAVRKLRTSPTMHTDVSVSDEGTQTILDKIDRMLGGKMVDIPAFADEGINLKNLPHARSNQISAAELWEVRKDIDRRIYRGKSGVDPTFGVNSERVLKEARTIVSVKLNRLHEGKVGKYMDELSDIYATSASLDKHFIDEASTIANLPKAEKGRIDASMLALDNADIIAARRAERLGEQYESRHLIDHYKKFTDRENSLLEVADSFMSETKGINIHEIEGVIRADLAGTPNMEAPIAKIKAQLKKLQDMSNNLLPEDMQFTTLDMYEELRKAEALNAVQGRYKPTGNSIMKIAGRLAGYGAAGTLGGGLAASMALGAGGAAVGLAVGLGLRSIVSGVSRVPAFYAMKGWVKSVAFKNKIVTSVLTSGALKDKASLRYATKAGMFVMKQPGTIKAIMREVLEEEQSEFMSTGIININDPDELAEISKQIMFDTSIPSSERLKLINQMKEDGRLTVAMYLNKDAREETRKSGSSLDKAIGNIRVKK